MFGDRGIPIIAEPVLAEAMRSSCDLSLPLDGKKKRFPFINFENVEKEGNLWFLKNDSSENQ